MKRIFSMILAMAFAYMAHATVHTVSNNVYSVGMFDNVQDAIDAASPGDTVLLVASTTSYGNFTIPQSLVVIGAGYAIEGSISQVGAITMDPGLASSMSDVVISGFEVSSIGADLSKDVDNVTIENCMINQVINVNGYNLKSRDGWIIQNNIFNSANISNGSYEASTIDLIIRNNIFTKTSSAFYYINANTLITNNTFIGSNNTNKVFVGISNLVITNNIFYNISVEGCDYCNFTNNISYLGTATSFSYDNNTGGSNLEATDPEFRDLTGLDFVNTDDYRLSDTSPGKTGGSDNKEIGAYGGDYPFPFSPDNAYPDNAVPGLPAILEMNVQNASLKKDDVLKVKIKAISNN